MLDDVACSKTLACADLDVPLVLAPSVSAGAQGPASITACVTVANAEVLASLVLHQLGKPGAPFVMGVGTGVMNMQTAVEVYNGPGVFVGNQAQLDVIRWYGLPSWHYSGHSDSKTLDEQWALELGIATILGALSRATLLHDVGYLESGLQSSYESIVLGDHLLGWAKAFMAPLPVDDESLAVDDIATVGSFGDFLSLDATMRHMRDTSQPELIDRRVREDWERRGGTDMYARAMEKAKGLLQDHRPEPLPDDVQAEVRRIVDLADKERAGRA